MKFLLCLITITLGSLQLMAQTSPLSPVCTFNYQAVVRAADDAIIADQNVIIQFTILDGPGGNELYIEKHETTTSSLGLVNLEVGSGNVAGGSMVFDAIPWIIRKHFLKVDMDMDGSGNFIFIGEAPILAVPIAIQAKVASFATVSLDTIKRIDTLRVDTLKVIKMKVDTICVKDVLKIDDGELVMRDFLGDTIFYIDEDGNSYHSGLEVFDGGISILDIFGFPILDIDPFLGVIFHEGIEINGDLDITNGGIKMVDENGDVLFSVDTFGNSHHSGFETFAGGLEILGLDGQPIFTVDPILEFFFGINTHTRGNVEIEDGNFEMRNDNGEVVFSVDKDGNSFHAGHEVFANGISLINFDKLEIFSIEPNANPFSEYAFQLQGNAMINGILQAEVKNFVIDHPLDPEHKTLRHYSIESDQMGTIYNGTVSFDDNGEAEVELPNWFEALNTDFSYQLTCIGGFSNVYISEQIENNKFKIAGGKEGLKVSWQVSAVRHDPVSNKHKKPIEEMKTNGVTQNKL